MPISFLTSRFTAVALILLALAGCGILPEMPSAPPADSDEARAQQLYQEQDYANAASAYLALADKYSGAKRQTFLLSAADAALLGVDIDTARAALQKLGPQPLSADQQLLRQLLQAGIALYEQRADQALALLLDRQPAPDSRLALRKRYYHTLADAYWHRGEYALSARALQNRHDLLQDDQQRLEQQIELLSTLNRMSTQALTQQLSVASKPIDGWIQLALLNRQHRGDLLGLESAYRTWRSQFPVHPALLDEIMAHQQQLHEQIETVEHIGVLLPQTGKYAKVAEAIRDGMLFSMQRMPTGQRPTLKFYDASGGQPVDALYKQAVSDGADFVIGPLQKEVVTQLVRTADLSVPMLALNIVDLGGAAPDNVYMYALDPENEAHQAAERMRQDGKRSPVALVPDNPWGERLLNAFSEHWRSLGGGAVGAQRYNPQSYDHTKAITALLQINRSKARHAQLQRWLGRSLEFTPRRRTDVDAVFLATRTRQATAFRPQFRYHLAGDLPIYTTSHIWRGQVNRQQLSDMRGIILPDIPLIAFPAQRAALAQHLPGVRGGLVRLYAMGMDAFDLVQHLQRLQSSPYESLEGQTGRLHMDSENRIRRELVWLKLDSPVKNLGYTDRPNTNPTEMMQTVSAPDAPAPVEPPASDKPAAAQQDNGSAAAR